MTFSLLQMLSILGLAQALLVLVYVLFRAGSWRDSVLTVLFLASFAGAFLADFAAPIYETQEIWSIISQFSWALVVHSAALLTAQVIRLGRLPNPLVFVPITIFLIGSVFVYKHISLLTIVGAITGAAALLFLLSERAGFSAIYASKASGREKYWLCLSLILMSCGLIFVSLVPGQDQAIRSVLGLACIYLAGTAMFRIYPQTIMLQAPSFARMTELSASEIPLRDQIIRLLEQDKVYQEPAYGRKDLARECGVSEAVISKIVNVHFKKSLPYVLNSFRVQDAQRLLMETAHPMKVIAEIVGFNSLASFNRVFKEHTGLAPSEFQAKHAPPKTIMTKASSV